jgi:hypothetical protein
MSLNKEIAKGAPAGLPPQPTPYRSFALRQSDQPASIMHTPFGLAGSTRDYSRNTPRQRHNFDHTLTTDLRETVKKLT